MLVEAEHARSPNSLTHETCARSAQPGRIRGRRDTTPASYLLVAAHVPMRSHEEPRVDRLTVISPNGPTQDAFAAPS